MSAVEIQGVTPMTFLIEDDVIRDLVEASVLMKLSPSEIASSVLRRWARLQGENLFVMDLDALDRVMEYQHASA